MSRTIICAHRGLDDRAPENTLAAFNSAFDKGMAIELDVQLSLDGQPVIMHDDTVDRTTDGSGRVSQCSLADLQRLDAGRWYGPQFAGQRVPTLDEVLELANRRARVSPAIVLDVKGHSDNLVETICDCIAKYGLFEGIIGIGACIGSADLRRRFRATAKQFQCAAVAQTHTDLDAALSDADSTWVYGRYVPTPATSQQVQRAGKHLLVCGDEVSRNVERAHDAYRAGPDMVLSSHPSRLAELTGM